MDDKDPGAANSDATTLKTQHLDLTLLDAGLSLASLVVNHPSLDSPSDLLIGYENHDHHHHSHARSFTNVLVGRYANRLPSGELKLKSGATLNLGGAEGVCLHGGENGFDTLPWTPLARTDSSLFPAEDPDHAVPPPASDPAAPIAESSSLHRIYSPAGADGFPCSLEVEVLTVVVASKEEDTETEKGRKGLSLGKVKIVMRAKIREDGDEGIAFGTPLNLTMHWGFRLDDNKDPDVRQHRLYLASDQLVSLDEHGLATGELDSLKAGDELDFFSAGLDGQHRTIGERYPEGGIDRNFLFSVPPPSPTSTITPTSSARLSTTPQAILTSPSSSPSQFQLRFTSNQPSVQFYTAAHMDGSGPARKALHGGEGEDGEGKQGYDGHGAVFLEFQHPVGTVVHSKEGPEGEKELGKWVREWAEERKAREEGRAWEETTLLRKGEVYENWVEVEVVLFDK